MIGTVVRSGVVWAPGASRKSGSYTGGPAKGLLHATIAPADVVPGYRNQTVAPHETLIYRNGRVTPVTHYYFDQYAKALRNAPGGVQTNRDTVLQWELAGYLGSGTPSGEFDILTAPDSYWEQVGALVGPVLRSWGVQAHMPTDWTPSGRMSMGTWDNFSGLCAHVHAPENTHWDLPVPVHARQILAQVIWGNVTPPNKPTDPGTVKVPFPLPAGHYFGVVSSSDRCHSGTYSSGDRRLIRLWQSAANLRQHMRLSVDGVFGPASRAAAIAIQRSHNLTPDGLVGPATWNATWIA